MKKSFILQLTLIPLLVVGFAFTAKASATPPTITINEVSDLVLTYSINGGATQTVNASTPDNWDFSTTAFIMTNLGGNQDQFVNYKENDYATAGDVNEVRFQQNGNGSEVTVISDHVPGNMFEQGYPLVANGGTYDFSGPPSSISGGGTATFNDDADSSESVPDAGGTVLLLLISGAALFVIQRRQARQIA